MTGLLDGLNSQSAAMASQMYQNDHAYQRALMEASMAQASGGAFLSTVYPTPEQPNPVLLLLDGRDGA